MGFVDGSVVEHEHRGPRDLLAEVIDGQGEKVGREAPHAGVSVERLAGRGSLL